MSPDCKTCKHYNIRLGAESCTAQRFSKSIQWMRSEKSACGPEGYLHEEKSKKYSQYEDL